MVNFYCTGCYGDRAQDLLCEHWRRSDVAYSFIDYNLSLKCSREVSLRHCRVPVDVSSVSMFIPSDLYLAPPFYNPFAYDVACLGNLFRYTFSVCSAHFVCLVVTETTIQELVPRFPLLAPLFDKMTTSVVSQRFTAEDALSFFEYAVSQLSDEERHSTFTLDQNSMMLGQTGTYWTLLPASFHARWKGYKSPPLHWGMRVLHHVTEWDITWRVARFVREHIGH